MRSHRSYYIREHIRKPKKSGRRLLRVGLLGTLLLLSAYGIATFNNRAPSASFFKTTQQQLSQSTLPKNIQLAWPSVGQAAVGSVEDGLLAHSSNNEKPRPTASMAKVITALAIMEKRPFKLGQAGQSYTMTSEDVAIYRAHVANGGSVMPVYEGMELTEYEALQAMLIASANNIADTLVEREFGSIEAYTSYAQDMVRRMGLSQTIIADASGYSSETVSAPSELVAIGVTALKNPVIAEIVAQPQAWIPGVGVIKNTNELLGTEGVVGIKTGTTDEAGKCLLFAAHYQSKDKRKVTIVGVIMGDGDAASLFTDTRNLLTSAKHGFNLTDI
jgi:D-alanyl-D-alanine carboxypeptidase (penicillin-binding protein 5/6)